MGARKSVGTLLQRIQVLVQRDDFRHNPVRALFRRAAWRLRWKLYPDKPWLLRAHSAFPLLATQGGPGALIYYQGSSKPETAGFIKRILRPGMDFVDVGAHLGEYAVLASALVRPSGSVHAFEPRPDILFILQMNLRLNWCQNVTIRSEAVSDRTGLAEYEFNPEPSKSALQIGKAEMQGDKIIKVRTITLDDYFSSFKITKPSLIRIDAEGAELHVLRGAESVLTRPRTEAPVVIFEYEPRNTRRFGYSAYEIINLLQELGYSIYDCRSGELQRLERFAALPERGFGCNLIAAKTALSI